MSETRRGFIKASLAATVYLAVGGTIAGASSRTIRLARCEITISGHRLVGFTDADVDSRESRIVAHGCADGRAWIRDAE